MKLKVFFSNFFFVLVFSSKLEVGFGFGCREDLYLRPSVNVVKFWLFKMVEIGIIGQ